MSILKDIPELLQAGVITQDTADNIQDYYKNKKGSSTNKLFVVFGILGAMLIGLGIILIIAHNWDLLSRTVKISFAFIPLLIGQIVCGFALVKKQESTAWREGGTTFLFFAIGSSISLVSQIYNIPGDLGLFLLVWMVLALPLIYIMNSSIASLLYLLGIIYYAYESANSRFFSYPEADTYLYWLLLLLALPHYYLLYKKKPKSNFMLFHHWIIPLSLILTLGTLTDKTDELMFVAYFSLFGLLYLIGDSTFFAGQKLKNNAYKTLGIIGTLSLLLASSFSEFWTDMRKDSFHLSEVTTTIEFWLVSIISLLADLPSHVALVLINIYVLAIGVLTVKNGAKQNSLGVLNFGLIIITVLIICRFFDTDLTFVVRGLLFISVGVGFFVTNYWMLKKRKTNE